MYNNAMSYNPGASWKIYSFIFALLVITNLAIVLSPSSELYIYHHILMAFSRSYGFSYYLRLIAAIVNLFALIPLFMFSFRKNLLNRRLWQTILIIRIIFDITGHSYEFKSLKAILYIDLWTGLSLFILAAAFILPSYEACFRYAFSKKNNINK